MSAAAKTKIFLQEIGMHPDCINLDVLKADFLEEMEKGLSGTGSSLMMIPTYIQAGGAVPDGEPVIVMDAGGTNFRSGLLTFEKGQPILSHLQTGPLPGTQGTITKEAFLTAIAESILPLAELSDKIGFCFSFASEILPNRDGRLVSFNKEVSVTGSAGMYVGRELLEKLRDLGVRQEMHFTLLNDTVACQLGGLAQLGDGAFDGMAGFILGTGTNACYLERGARITKLTQPAEDMIINMEAGGFNRASRGESDCRLDARTANPGVWLFEKMISGAYHGGVMTESVALAQAAGLLSVGFPENFAAGGDFTMQEVDAFLASPFGQGRIAAFCHSEADVAVLYTIFDQSFERAGKLICGLLAAVVEAVDGGKAPWRPFIVSADGSAFYKSRLLRGKLEKYVDRYIEEKMGKYLSFIHADNGNLTGAAAAALLNT